VSFIQNGWNPDPMNPADPPPQGIAVTPIANTGFAAALLNAFQLAPPAFQAHLCGLNSIYVNGTPCTDAGNCMLSSWGYRAAKSNTSHIAISAGLWNQSCSDGTQQNPYPYHCFESDLLGALLNWSASGGTPPPPRYASANREADTFDMVILAALAHEVGHVRWYQLMNRGNPGRAYNPNLFCGGAFFVNSWVTPIRMIPPPWRGFGDRDRNNSHYKSPQISTIDREIGQQDWQDAAIDLDLLYHARQPWASFFAALSPDEDFVESYKLYVLTNAQQVSNEGPLTSLKITFVSGSPEDIPSDYGLSESTNLGVPTITKKSVLAKKTMCIAQSM
jgi:hypothetical protein